MAAFFREQKEVLVQAWTRRVREDEEVPRAAALPDPALVDHFPIFIEQYAARFARAERASEDMQREVGATRTVHEHAQVRFDQHYDLRAALRELAIFRLVVLDACADLGVVMNPHEAALFHATLDEAFATSALEMERLRRAALAASEASLRHEAELRERFVAILSHDLRNPLQTVSLAIQTVLQYGRGLGDRDRKLLDRAVDCSARMARMIDDLLDFTRARRGTIPVTAGPTDAAGVARKVADEFRSSTPDRDVHVHAEGDTSGTWDPDRLAQMLSNLIGNALQHGASDAPVHVSILGRTTVSIDVHNAGLPMTREQIATAFEPFQRTRRRRTGLGLGLFIVREIARAHGGHVEVTSTELDGTRFIVTLPRQSTDK